MIAETTNTGTCINDNKTLLRANPQLNAGGIPSMFLGYRTGAWNRPSNPPKANLHFHSTLYL
jgi:hypothetical protein